MEDKYFAFVLVTMVGIVIHLRSIDLPFPKRVISSSVILFCGLLA
ncbi:HupE/UreJ family protein [cyanobacterium endosymbiont of Rhopalodia gibberula]